MPRWLPTAGVASRSPSTPRAPEGKATVVEIDGFGNIYVDVHYDEGVTQRRMMI